MNRVAYCYYTNGKPGSHDYRALSRAGLDRYLGDVPVFTLVAGREYKDRFKWENVIDATKFCCGLFGTDAETLYNPWPGCCGSPAGLFAKYAIPLMPEFAGFDRVVVMDDDVEILSPRFAGAGNIALRPDADVAMIARDWPARPFSRIDMWKPERREWWTPGTRWHNGGLAVMRGGLLGTADYRSRVREAFRMMAQHKFWLNEESAMNQFLSIQTIGPELCVVPKIRCGRQLNWSYGAGRDLASKTAALHYPGGRKRVVYDAWARRVETGCPYDFSAFER